MNQQDKLDKLKIVNFKRENRDCEKVLKQGEDSVNFDSIISKIPIVTVVSHTAS